MDYVLSTAVITLLLLLLLVVTLQGEECYDQQHILT